MPFKDMLITQMFGMALNSNYKLSGRFEKPYVLN